MTVAIYAGSFDPITNGHLDIIKQGSEIFDKVIIAVARNINKKNLLTAEERVKLIKSSVAGIKNAEVDLYDGLTVEYAKRKNVSILLRGLRNIADFENEVQLSRTNASLNCEIKSIYLISKPENSHISSSCVKEILAYNGDISEFVPMPVLEYFKK